MNLRGRGSTIAASAGFLLLLAGAGYTAHSSGMGHMMSGPMHGMAEHCGMSEMAGMGHSTSECGKAASARKSAATLAPCGNGTGQGNADGKNGS